MIGEQREVALVGVFSDVGRAHDVGSGGRSRRGVGGIGDGAGARGRCLVVCGAHKREPRIYSGFVELGGNANFGCEFRNCLARVGVGRGNRGIFKRCGGEQALGGFLRNAAAHEVVQLFGAHVANGSAVVARDVVFAAQDNGNRLVLHALVGEDAPISVSVPSAPAQPHAKSMVPRRIFVRLVGEHAVARPCWHVVFSPRWRSR